MMMIKKKIYTLQTNTKTGMLKRYTCKFIHETENFLLVTTPDNHIFSDVICDLNLINKNILAIKKTTYTGQT